MRAMIDQPNEVQVAGRGAGRRDVHGRIARGGKAFNVILTMAGMGNNQAASRATRMLDHYPSVDIILMVGIAGGVPSVLKPAEHVRLGDIVISDKGGVINNDFVKEEVGHEEVRAKPIAPSSELLEAVSYLQAGEIEDSRPWEIHLESRLRRLGWKRPSAKNDILLDSTQKRNIQHPPDPDRRPKQPRVFLGPIAAADRLLKNPIKRDALRDRFGVKAVEMEGSGIADATWNQGCGYLVVRGICDYCDGNKNDLWQRYASAAAAAYARALIESLPNELRTNVSKTPDSRLPADVTISFPPAITNYLPALANRSVEFSAFTQCLSEDAAKRIIFFQGPTNLGKTTLIRECEGYAEKLLSTGSCITIDFKTDTSKDFVLETIRLQSRTSLPSFSVSGKTVFDLRADLYKLDRPLLLLFDAYERGSDEARELVKLILSDIRKLSGVRIVVAGQVVPLSVNIPCGLNR